MVRMRARLWHVPLALALGAPFGCGNPKDPEVPVAEAPLQGMAPAEAESPPDLTPVAAPANLVALASWRTPARSMSTITGWTGLGIDWRTWLEAGPAAAFLPVLDLAAPIDAAITLDPESKNRPRAFFAVSLGLTSRQAALDTFQRMEMPAEFVEPGVHSVRVSSKTLCLVTSALGQASARLVCGQDRESLDSLAPYLTRGNPSSAAGDADLHVELAAETAYRMFGDKAQFLKLGVPMMLGEMSIGNPAFDEALRAAATALVDEVILELGDLKNIAIDGWVRGAGQGGAGEELELAFGVNFRGAKSWMAQALASSEANAAPAPATYWELPVDATEAFYYVASKPELMRPMLQHLERLVQSGLAYLGASPQLQAAWPASLREMLNVPGPTVSARGAVPAQFMPASPGARDELRASLGYTVVGVDDEQNRYGKWLEQTLDLYEDASLRKGLSQKYGIDPGKLPKVKSRRGPPALPESRVYEIEVPPALFAAALDDTTTDPATLGGPIPVALIACREGQRTWLGLSSYLPLVEERLTALVKSAQPREATLANRSGLDRLRLERSNVGGFWTVAGLQSGMSLGQGELRRLLSALGKSETPIVGQVTSSAQGPSSRLELHVPSQLFLDLAR